jgi:hypothetical protein
MTLSSLSYVCTTVRIRYERYAYRQALALKKGDFAKKCMTFTSVLLGESSHGLMTVALDRKLMQKFSFLFMEDKASSIAEWRATPDGFIGI